MSKLTHKCQINFQASQSIDAIASTSASSTPVTLRAYNDPPSDCEPRCHTAKGVRTKARSLIARNSSNTTHIVQGLWHRTHQLTRRSLQCVTRAHAAQRVNVSDSLPRLRIQCTVLTTAARTPHRMPRKLRDQCPASLRLQLRVVSSSAIFTRAKTTTSPEHAEVLQSACISHLAALLPSLSCHVLRTRFHVNCTRFSPRTLVKRNKTGWLVSFITNVDTDD